MARNPAWECEEIILALGLYVKKGHKILPPSAPEIIELSEFLNRLPNSKNATDTSNYRNSNSVSMKLSNFKFFDPEKEIEGLPGGSVLDQELFKELAHDHDRLGRLAASIREIPELGLENLESEDPDVSDFEATEGRLLFRLHLNRERSPKLAKQKKEQVLRLKGGLVCEGCSFDFRREYGQVSDGFIECHHTIPLSELSKDGKTKLSDLSLLCSNCPSMIHRTKPIMTVEEFKGYLRGVKKTV